MINEKQEQRLHKFWDTMEVLVQNIGILRRRSLGRISGGEADMTLRLLHFRCVRLCETCLRQAELAEQYLFGQMLKPKDDTKETKVAWLNEQAEKVASAHEITFEHAFDAFLSPAEMLLEFADSLYEQALEQTRFD